MGWPGDAGRCQRQSAREAHGSRWRGWNGARAALRVGQRRRKSQKIAGVFLLQPVQHVGKRVLEGPGEAVGDAHGVTAPAATVLDELGAGAHRRALRPERRAACRAG